MKEEAKHHSQVRPQSTMSNEISAVPPNNNNGSFELQPRSPPQQYLSSIVQPTPSSAITQVHRSTTQLVPPHVDAMRKNWFEDMRGWIMVVAVLVASVTYTTGLNPPGGFWQDDKDNYKAGSSILRDKLPHRYTTFFYANATAFMTSLVIIILLMNKTFYDDKPKVVILYISMVLDLGSLMIAYAAGCARSLPTSIFMIVLAVVVFLFVVYSAYILPFICLFIKNRFPGMPKLVRRYLLLEKDLVQERGRGDTTRSSSI